MVNVAKSAGILVLRKCCLASMKTIAKNWASYERAQSTVKVTMLNVPAWGGAVINNGVDP